MRSGREIGMARDSQSSMSQAGSRGVSLLGAVAIGIGGMVGGGIFAVLGVAAEQAGGATPVAFAVAGAVAAVTAYSYSRLSNHFRSAGGTVTFVDRVFGVDDFTGALNIVLWVGYIATTALYVSASSFSSAVGFTLVAVSALLATLSATNATLYGSARLTFTLATEGELTSSFERLEWNQPIGLHITALVGLALAVGLPLTSISTVCSAILLMVFSVVNAAAFKAAREIQGRRWLTGLGALGCTTSLLVLVVRSVSQDPVGLIVLLVLLVSALTTERRVLRHRRRVPH